MQDWNTYLHNVTRLFTCMILACGRKPDDSDKTRDPEFAAHRTVMPHFNCPYDINTRVLIIIRITDTIVHNVFMCTNCVVLCN